MTTRYFDLEFAEPGKCEQLSCEGRPCAKCHKCRDWHFTGDHDTWKWITNCKNWDADDLARYNRDRTWELFKKRGDATCDGVFGGLPGFFARLFAGDKSGPGPVSRVFPYRHVCVCQKH